MTMFDDGGMAERCALNADYVADRKDCDIDADCDLFTYQAECCGDQLVVAVARTHVEALLTCREAQRHVCACAQGLMRAEDGRAVTQLGPAISQCVDGQCLSRVADRTCGASRTCGPSEICVTYENVPGGIPPDPDSQDNAYLTFRCELNPCGEQLGCDCAQPLCDARNDAVRTCEIKNNTEADMTCSAVRD